MTTYDPFEYPEDGIPEALGELHHDLKALSLEGASRSSNGIISRLHSSSPATIAQDLIKEVCSNQYALARCAERSEIHPLGFEKYLLASTRWYQIRLHVWHPVDIEPPPEDVHDHRFSFLSVILTGRILVETFELCDDGVPMCRFLDRAPREAGQPYILEPVGVAHVRFTDLHELAPTSIYLTSAQSLHRVSADRSAVTSTLFIKLRSSKSDANVLATPPAIRSLRPPRTVFNVDVLGRQLMAAGEAIMG